MEEKLTQLQGKMEADQSFVEKLFSLENVEEVQSYLKENGLDFSMDEIAALKDDILAAAAPGGELSEEALEEVAGGIVAGNGGCCRLPWMPGSPLPTTINPNTRW